MENIIFFSPCRLLNAIIYLQTLFVTVFVINYMLLTNILSTTTLTEQTEMSSDSSANQRKRRLDKFTLQTVQEQQ